MDSAWLSAALGVPPNPTTFSRRPVFGSIMNHVSFFLPEYRMPSLERHGALATSCGIVYGNFFKLPMSPSRYRLPSRGSGKYGETLDGDCVGTFIAGSATKYRPATTAQ